MKKSFSLAVIFLMLSSPAFAATHYLECQVTDNNNGCSQTFRFPPEERIIGITAACNLEHGTVSNKQLRSISANTMKVVKRTGRHIGRSYCKVDDTKISTGAKTIAINYGSQEIKFGCKEHDRNGGDCHIRLKVTTTNW